jgi:HEAT repeat protein/beta-lactamase regulating signal transducer with metallopeptidase domain
MTTLELLVLLGGTLAKGAVILVLAEAGSRLLRRRSAAGRYAVWVVAFVGLLALPLLTLALPAWETPPLVRQAAPATDDMGLRHSSMAVATGMEMSRASQHAMMTDMADEPTRDAMTERMPAENRKHVAIGAAAPWMLGAWLMGVLVVVAMLVRDLRQISRVTRRATTLRRGPLYEMAHRVAAELGVRHPIRIALSREIEMPVTWGLRRPVVLLPSTARRWDESRRLVVLRHELAHVRRGDYAAHLMIEMACALHWLNPLAWRAAHRARLDQEQACDDRVLDLGTRSVEYAQQLLNLARTYAIPGGSARGALAMAAAATLPQRMRSILDVGVDRGPAGRRMLLAVAAAGLLVGVPTATLHTWSGGGARAELLSQANSSDPLLRRHATWALGTEHWSGARPALIERLQDTDPATRGMAAWALGRLGGRAAVAPLIAALEDRDAHVREMAVLALGDLSDSRAVAALAALAADPEPGVRSVTTVALKRIGGDSASESLARLLRSDPDPHARIMAASALSLVDGPRRIQALSSALADPDAGVRITAASSLEKVRDPAAVPALLRALDREEDLDVREALVAAAGASRDSRVTSALVRVLSGDVPRLREAAAKTLGEIGDQTAVESLIAATRDPDHRVRLTAVRALDALQAAR